jgi:NAD(P)H-flavin reductase
VLAKPSPSWKGAKGFVSADIIRDTMPAPGPDSRVLVCGPPGFMNAVSGGKTPDYKQGEVSGLLKAAGYNGEQCSFCCSCCCCFTDQLSMSCFVSFRISFPEDMVFKF